MKHFFKVTEGLGILVALIGAALFVVAVAPAVVAFLDRVADVVGLWGLAGLIFGAGVALMLIGQIARQFI